MGALGTVGSTQFGVGRPLEHGQLTEVPPPERLRQQVVLPEVIVHPICNTTHTHTHTQRDTTKVSWSGKCEARESDGGGAICVKSRVAFVVMLLEQLELELVEALRVLVRSCFKQAQRESCVCVLCAVVGVSARVRVRM